MGYLNGSLVVLYYRLLAHCRHRDIRELAGTELVAGTVRVHVHKWKFKRTKQGMRRTCRCGLKFLEIAVPKGSSLDGELKVLREKGKHYKNGSK